jgi:hypothetical protein
MEDESTKQLLVEIVNLLADLTDEVEQLVNPKAGVPWGKVPRAPDERAHRIQQKLVVVRAALKQVQQPKSS